MLVTTGTIVTVGGFAWKYWRIPVRLFQWWKAEDTELEVGQVWREAAGLSATNKDWKVTELDEDVVSFESVDREDDFGEAYELNLGIEEWPYYCKKFRMFCYDRNDTIHDTYWGDAAD